MSDILKQARLVNRVTFDPTNPEHVESFKVFLRTGNWGDIQFFPEIPFVEVPMTVMVKYSRHILGVEAETAAERAARIAQNPRLVTPAPEVSKADALAASNALMKATLLAA